MAGQGSCYPTHHAMKLRDEWGTRNGMKKLMEKFANLEKIWHRPRVA